MYVKDRCSTYPKEAVLLLGPWQPLHLHMGFLPSPRAYNIYLVSLSHSEFIIQKVTENITDLPNCHVGDYPILMIGCNLQQGSQGVILFADLSLQFSARTKCKQNLCISEH